MGSCISRLPVSAPSSSVFDMPESPLPAVEAERSAFDELPTDSKIRVQYEAEKSVFYSRKI